MKKYPEISCNIEHSESDKNIDGTLITKLIVEQNNDIVNITEKKSLNGQEKTVTKVSGKIITFNSFIQFAKILLNTNNIIWFDYQRKTLNTSRAENFMYFKMNNFKANISSLKELTKFFNIAMSMTALNNYSFSFTKQPEIYDDFIVYKSNLINGFGVKAFFYEKENFKELKMTLIAPVEVIFDIEVGINFLSVNQGYIRLFAMNEISNMIFKRIKLLSNTNNSIEEI